MGCGIKCKKGLDSTTHHCLDSNKNRVLLCHDSSRSVWKLQIKINQKMNEGRKAEE